MPVLLLCQGEEGAKEMLRKAIEARYGINPPAIEKITIAFKGRARTKMGPVTTWVPVDAEASFVFPTHLRWEFTVKPLGLPVQRGVEAYDGKVYRSTRAIGASTKSEETAMLVSARSRLWQMAATLLSPMSDYFIKVTQYATDCIEAENTKLNDSVLIYLRPDHTIKLASVICYNPDANRHQKLNLEFTAEQAPVDGLMLPEEIKAFWDDEAYFEMKPIKVDLHPDLPEELFTLGDELVSDSI
jgi:hypothetical protein